MVKNLAKKRGIIADDSLQRLRIIDKKKRIIDKQKSLRTKVGNW